MRRLLFINIASIKSPNRCVPDMAVFRVEISSSIPCSAAWVNDRLRITTMNECKNQAGNKCFTSGVEAMPAGIGFSLFESQLYLPAQTVGQKNILERKAFPAEVGDNKYPLLILPVPANDQPKNLPSHLWPFHIQIHTAVFGKMGQNIFQFCCSYR